MDKTINKLKILSLLPTINIVYIHHKLINSIPLTYKSQYYPNTYFKSLTNLTYYKVPPKLKLSPKLSYWWLQYLTLTNSILKNNNYISTRFWFLVYLQLYLKRLGGYRFNWYFIDFNKTLKHSRFIQIWYKVRSYKLIRYYFGKKKELFNRLVKFLFFKRLSYFISIIELVISELPLKKHKRHFVKVKKILLLLLKLFKSELSFLGFSVFFKGKLGRKGSVKKSVYFYKYGRVSLGNKSLRLTHKKLIIHTETGVVGGGVSLFF